MDGSDTRPPRYRAFITYCHRDEILARWLHRALESYRVPRHLIGRATSQGPVPARLGPIFRDREELSSAPDLGATINRALEQSANLIVVCSPSAAASRWVDLEISEFKRLGRTARIFCVIVAGEPFASAVAGIEASECFPPALRLAGEEPIAADLRAGKDRKIDAKLKLIAGLLNLEFDDLKQREQQRHIRRLTAGVIASGVIATTTIALAAGAYIERNAAQRRQKQAENLVDFMLGDLYEKLYKVQRLDLLATVNDRSMAYFESLPTADQSSAALSLRVRAMTNIGNTRLDQGNSAEALLSYQRALDLASPQAAAAPKDAALQLRQAELMSYVGMAYWRQGELDKAEVAFDSAQGILEKQRADPARDNDAQLLVQLASVYNNVGHIQEARGRLDDAVEQYRRMESIWRTLVAVDPDNAEWEENYGLAHNNLGKMSLLRGDLIGAIAEYQTDDAIEAKLYEKDPGNASQHEQMSVARAIYGRTVALAGYLDLGIRNLSEASDIAQQLLAQDSSATYAQDDVAWYGVQLSRLLREGGDFARAEAVIKRSIEILNALTETDRANAGWQLELGQALVERAQLARDRSDDAAVREASRAALRILEPLFAKQPGDRSTLIAEVAAQLLSASALLTDSNSQRIARDHAVQLIHAANSGGEDPRLLALTTEALLASGKRDEAMPLIQKLQQSGFREPDFISLLSRSRIVYPVNPITGERMASLLRQETLK